MTAIHTQGLHKYYEGFHALKGIDLTVEKGEFFGLLGPNGAGKSTFINILAGLVKASSGSAAVYGYDVTKNFRQARQSLGVVPQEIVQDVFFTVKELLYMQAGFYGLKPDKAWINELLEILQLKDKANSRMRQLSGGMKRRLMIAQAMVHKPPVIVLDEPTAGVDVDLRESLWKFITELHQRGHTVILTTHYLEEAQALCDRIAIINEGRLIALDSKSELIKQYAERDICITIPSDVKALPPILRTLSVQQEANHQVLQFKDNQMPMGEVFMQLQQSGIQIIDVKIKEPSLQAAFSSLIKQPVGHQS